MGSQIRKGSLVEWQWASGSADGKVVAVHHERVERTIKGSRITRNGTHDDPALDIETEDGGRVLKLRSEVEHS